MADLTREYVQSLTDDQLNGALASEFCIGCSQRKTAGRPFCANDYVLLSLPMRLDLRRTGPELLAAVRRCLWHLAVMDPERRKPAFVTSDRGVMRWPHYSHEDLEAAGYRFSGHALCGAPKCNARIVWYRTPRGKRLAVNLADYAPHFASCAAPDYFRLRREEKRVQASAKRAATRARRKARRG